MPVDSSSEQPNSEQLSSNESTRSSSVSESHTGRRSAWVASNGQYIETALAVIAIGVGALALPLVAFGIFTALEGETSVLSAGAIFGAFGFVTLGSLAVVLLVHARVEVRRHGLSFNDGHTLRAAANTIVRIVETVLAGMFLVSVLSVIVTVIVVGYVPDLLPPVVGISALLLPVVVIAHGCGSTVRYVLDLE